MKFPSRTTTACIAEATYLLYSTTLPPSYLILLLLASASHLSREDAVLPHHIIARPVRLQRTQAQRLHAISELHPPTHKSISSSYTPHTPPSSDPSLCFPTDHTPIAHSPPIESRPFQFLEFKRDLHEIDVQAAIRRVQSSFFSPLALEQHRIDVCGGSGACELQ